MGETGRRPHRRSDPCRRIGAYGEKAIYDARMSSDAEFTQELGREGVAIIKRWLEATTFIELPFDAYHHKKEVTILHPGGKKKLDLGGHYLTGRKSPVYVECKRYSSPGRQHKEFRRLLAIAYGNIQREREIYEDPKYDSNANYIWVTFNPFAQDRWPSLETHSELGQGLHENTDVHNGDAMDDEVARAVADRFTVLVFNKKQERLSLNREELMLVRTVIDRKAEAL